MVGFVRVWGCKKGAEVQGLRAQTEVFGWRYMSGVELLSTKMLPKI